MLTREHVIFETKLLLKNDDELDRISRLIYFYIPDGETDITLISANMYMIYLNTRDRFNALYSNIEDFAYNEAYVAHIKGLLIKALSTADELY